MGIQALLSPRDWIYSLSLLVPFIVYELALKAASVASVPGLALTFDLIRSDVFFDLGYTLLWIGLFVAVRRGLLHRAMVVLFHVTTMLLVIVTTSAYQYFQETGTALNYGVIALWLPKFMEVLPVLAYGGALWAWVILATALAYVALGPWLVTCAVERWRGWMRDSSAVTPGISFFGFLGHMLLAFCFGSLSLLIGASSTDFSSGASVSLARAPVINVLLTGVEESSAAEANNSDISSPTEHPAAHASLAATPQTEKRNVVLIHLEATYAGAATP